MDGAVGWEGCVDGNGIFRREVTTGMSDWVICGENGADAAVVDGLLGMLEIKEGGRVVVGEERLRGVEPLDASATIFVYSCESFFPPVSTSRA
jgi:hypothetical protein